MSQQPALSLQTALDNVYMLQGERKKEVYLYLSLKAGAAQEQSKRIPLNLSLVLDRSGSMTGDKLEYAKKAARFVVSHLSAEDCISLVQYDSSVEVVQPSAPVIRKEQLYGQLDQITAGSTTYLSGGMLEGYHQAQRTRQSNYVNRVLLLTDGLANTGITEPAALQGLARQHFQEEHIGLSTFGVGADFNEELLTGLAEYGRGNYYFIDTPDQIPGIFARELEGLLSVVAQNVVLQVKFPSRHFSLLKVYGYTHTLQEDTVTLRLGEVYAQDEKGILLAFTLDHPFAEEASFDVSLSYTDAHALQSFQQREGQTLYVTQQPGKVTSGANQLVLEQIAFFKASEKLQEAIREADSRDFDAARQKSMHTLRMVAKSVDDFPSSARLKEQLKQTIDYQEQIKKMENWSDEEFSSSQKMAKFNLLKRMKGRKE